MPVRTPRLHTVTRSVSEPLLGSAAPIVTVVPGAVVGGGAAPQPTSNNTTITLNAIQCICSLLGWHVLVFKPTRAVGGIRVPTLSLRTWRTSMCAVEPGQETCDGVSIGRAGVAVFFARTRDRLS